MTSMIENDTGILPLNERAAYQGGSWNLRLKSHCEEIQLRQHWLEGGIDSEFESLQSVMIYRPQNQAPNIEDPEKVQHLGPLNWEKIRQESSQLKVTFEKLGIKVHELVGDDFPSPPPNLMFVRDHFFMTPWGAILGRMASSVRAGEEKWAQLALARAGIPILMMINGQGLFEGADALWLNPRQVLIGIGNRTNEEAFLQIRRLLSTYGVQSISVQLPRSVQHLLGLLQIIDKNLALLRTELDSNQIRIFLRKNFYSVVSIPEIKEVTEGQGFNLVCLGQKRIIMAENCPTLKALYLKQGLKIEAELSFREHIQAAGGIACATAIVKRQTQP